MKANKLEPLSKIQKVEAPGYLLTRLEGALEEVQLLVPKKLIWAYMAIFLLFISIQIGIFSKSTSSSSLESYASSIGINTPYSLYYE